MTKTVKEWIDFLNMGNNHYVGLKKKDGVNCSIENYHPVSECAEKFDGWLNEIVIKAYVINFESNGNYNHLLIF